jgi:hypothetical protein
MVFKHLHIVACSPRSGTTLLHEVMVTCFRIDKHYDHEIRFHLVKADDGQTLITKRPKDTMYMPAVIDGDPELYVIYVMRDPRDTICSRHGKEKSIYYSNIRLWRQMHEYSKKMAGHERFLEVRYEDFVRDPDATQELIAEKFPWLEKTHNFSEYHEYAQVSEKSITAMHSVRPIAPTSVGVWTKNPGRIKAQQMIHGSLSPDLIECGYETSADWEKVLVDVEPDFTKSLYPEKLYIWSRLSQYLNGLRKVARYRRLRRESQ